MRSRFICFLLVPIFLALPGRGSAQDLLGICEYADDQCRALAVGIESERLASGIGGTRPVLNLDDLLCGPEKPNCCPPEVIPVCTATADMVLDIAVHTLATVAMKEKCTISKSICDQIGSLWCKPDQSWNPWSGCKDPIVIAEPEPPTVCPPGKRPAGKPGLCEPIPCFHPFLNVEVPCAPDGPEILARDFEIPDPSGTSATGATANLLKLLADRSIAEEARRAVAQSNGRTLDLMRKGLHPFKE